MLLCRPAKLPALSFNREHFVRGLLYSAVALLHLALAPSSVILAQEPPAGVTFSGVLQKAAKTLAAMKSDQALLFDDSAGSFAGAVNEFSVLLARYSASAGSDLDKPLVSLPGGTGSDAAALYRACVGLDGIVNRPPNCLVLHSPAIVAGVRTVLLELGGALQSSRPVKGPRLDYFQFEGHPPFIVPGNGGRITIGGVALWRKMPPVVTIRDASGNDVLPGIVPVRSADDGVFSFTIGADLLSRFAGKCLDLRVEPREKRLLGVKSGGVLTLPLCVPDAEKPRLKAVAHLLYHYTEKAVETLPFRQFLLVNRSCADSVTVKHVESWDIRGGTIIGYVYGRGGPDVQNGGDIVVTYSGNAITAAGMLDKAVCAGGPGPSRLLHSTYWKAELAPKISFEKDHAVEVTGESGMTPMQALTTGLSVPLSKTRTSEKGSDIFSYEIIVCHGDRQKSVYRSNSIATGAFSESSDGLTLDAELHSTPVNGQAELRVTVGLSECGL
jgi:hypothetical protein